MIARTLVSQILPTYTGTQRARYQPHVTVSYMLRHRDDDYFLDDDAIVKEGR